MTERIDYQTVLNPSQLEAVMTLEGPVLVIAGAGSGKTRTLIYRVARIVESGVDPERILLLTFTRKAAGEMLERAASLADERCRHVSGGTFHSLAHSVLRRKADLLGFSATFTILDRSDMEEVMQALVKEMKVEKGAIRFPKRATVANILSKAANLEEPVESLMAEEYAQFLEYAPELNKLWHQYREYKKNNRLMDYDDLILHFRTLLAEHETVREELSQRFRYVMVDEYQDTNGIQSDIVKWLASLHRNIMVVGDDSQSIYSFRGANYRNMFDFPALFPGVKTVKLEENYRSTQPILNFTNSLMGQAQEKFTKCLFTSRKGGDKPKIINTRTQREQALFVSQTIQQLKGQGLSLNEMAVLFRAGYQSFDLELELARQGMPFAKFGGFKFMESAHIKDLLAHLRVVVNRNDGISWGRILRLIPNIGPSKSQKIIQWINHEQPDSGKIADWPGAGKGLEGLSGLGKLLKGLAQKDISPDKAVERVYKYYDPILVEKYDDFPKRQKDLEQLVSLAGRYKNLRSFLDDLTLEPPNSSVEIEQAYQNERLTLSTVHSAKGLEWSVVFIIWVMEGYFPAARSRLNQAMLEEERRLMYVAATRAKDQLILCYPGEEGPPQWASALDSHEVPQRYGLSSFIQTMPAGMAEYATYSPWSRGPRINLGQIMKKPAPVTEIEKKGSSGLRSGDRVRHPAFGPGVVARFIDQEKVEVLFKHAGKKLLHLAYTTLDKI